MFCLWIFLFFFASCELSQKLSPFCNAFSTWTNNDFAGAMQRHHAESKALHLMYFILGGVFKSAAYLVLRSGYEIIPVRPLSSSLLATQDLIYNKKFWEELIAYLPWYDTCHTENDASNNFSTVACVFVTAVTFLPSPCLATIGGFLPSRLLIFNLIHRANACIVCSFVLHIYFQFNICHNVEEIANKCYNIRFYGYQNC
jgi:hypothetical protein